MWGGGKKMLGLATLAAILGESVALDASYCAIYMCSVCAVVG